MEPDRASWTARAAASCRAHHYAYDPPRIFEDFLAGRLVTPEEREVIITGFDPRTLAEELAALGFELAEDLDPAEQHARYFLGRADGLRPFQFNHFVHARL
jgi:O-methyltransferase involved in polyketide biosynthesis